MTQSGEILYSILIEYDITVKVVRLIKVCLNKTCSKICIVKYVRCISYSEWSETRRCSISIAVQFCLRICRLTLWNEFKVKNILDIQESDEHYLHT